MKQYNDRGQESAFPNPQILDKMNLGGIYKMFDDETKSL